MKERYPYKIQAMVNSPLGGKVKKGEIGTYIEDGYYSFPSQERYSVRGLHYYEEGKIFRIINQIKEKSYYEIYG